ncbi:MAG: hypothetical protein IT357_14890 [Gemmatimonadaceae bacterium]|jgi:hypothetical protein|nr:hypothetical protein [Gemmatimonadaceae bacterium]
MPPTPLFAKLNLKDQRQLIVLDAPTSFEAELTALQKADPDVKVLRRVPANAPIAFALAFATTQLAVDKATAALTARAADDAILWMVYPKGSSKRYTCDFNRDTGWAALGAAGFEPVRMVAVDEDWSALRFRRVQHIKQLKRSADMAISAAGRARAKKK